MKIDSTLALARNEVSEARKQMLERDKAATDFEEIFARHLVKEMTKNTFKMESSSGVYGNSANMYREFINDALSQELAKQRKLGMADLVTRYWNQPTKP